MNIKTIANEYAERVCNGEFPITYTREQVVRHTANDFIAGAETYENQVKALSAIKKGLEKSLTEAFEKIKELEQNT